MSELGPKVWARYQPGQKYDSSNQLGFTSRPKLLVFYGSVFPLGLQPGQALDLFDPEAVMLILQEFRGHFTQENFPDIGFDQYQQMLLRLEDLIRQYRNIVP